MGTFLELSKYCTPEWQQFDFDGANNYFAQGEVAMMEQLAWIVQGLRG